MADFWTVLHDPQLAGFRRRGAELTAQLSDQERETLLGRFKHDRSKIETVCGTCDQIVRLVDTERDVKGLDACAGCREAS